MCREPARGADTPVSNGKLDALDRLAIDPSAAPGERLNAARAASAIRAKSEEPRPTEPAADASGGLDELLDLYGWCSDPDEPIAPRKAKQPRKPKPKCQLCGALAIRGGSCLAHSPPHVREQWFHDELAEMARQYPYHSMPSRTGESDGR